MSAEDTKLDMAISDIRHDQVLTSPGGLLKFVRDFSLGTRLRGQHQEFQAIVHTLNIPAKAAKS